MYRFAALLAGVGCLVAGALLSVVVLVRCEVWLGGWRLARGQRGQRGLSFLTAEPARGPRLASRRQLSIRKFRKLKFPNQAPEFWKLPRPIFAENSAGVRIPLYDCMPEAWLHGAALRWRCCSPRSFQRELGCAFSTASAAGRWCALLRPPRGQVGGLHAHRCQRVTSRHSALHEPPPHCWLAGWPPARAARAARTMCRRCRLDLSAIRESVGQ